MNAYSFCSQNLRTILVIGLFALGLLSPTRVLGQSVFDGTWRIDLQSTQYVGHQNHSLQNGLYQCSTCFPKISVKADGQDHKVSGSQYFDTVNVRPVDDYTVEIVSKKGGKIYDKTKLTASQDGKSLKTESTTSTGNGQQVSGNYTSTPVEAASEGKHKISGVWQPGKLENVTESMMTVTYKTTGEDLSMTYQAGDSYSAKFDGKDYPYKGNPGITSVSLKKSDGNTIEETGKFKGKVVSVNRMTVAPDGKTMSVQTENKLEGVTIKYTAEKQK